MGLEDELTASFVDDSTFWGCVRLYRHGGRLPFDAAEVAYLAALAPLLADSYRRAVLAQPSTVDERSAAPGIVILDDRARLEAMTPAAESWLEELIDIPRSLSTPLPHPIYALAARTRAGDNGGGLEARARLATKSGRWLVLHASPLPGGGPRRTAIVMQPAPSVEMAPLIVHAYGLTERERDVVQRVVSGLSTKEIAAGLGLSRYTVGDHLKAVFEKVGVGSRGELVARIFFDQYAPRLISQQA
jgi:DNA-binding CsgD family transcriptional regulator